MGTPWHFTVHAAVHTGDSAGGSTARCACFQTIWEKGGVRGGDAVLWCCICSHVCAEITEYVAVSVARAIGYLGLGFFNTVIWANITDVIDDQEVQTGHRDDGTVYAVYSFARKVGQALAGGIGGWALQVIGYEPAAAAQTDAVRRGLYTTATLVPAIGFFVVAAILWFVYPLDKRRVEKNVEELKEKNICPLSTDWCGGQMFFLCRGLLDFDDAHRSRQRLPAWHLPVPASADDRPPIHFHRSSGRPPDIHWHTARS